ncbi:hypothetical protein AVL48_04960 [Amycolatopsis regifaucium]|uniref:SF3 helicase domain-containing protein n=1 Tax=Amycolatopsis regifaucium TaxID=546365 RepID=A0A154M9Z1_9PSEU|nr:hypothetical protein AVL48_04960 [Amycolatopsis regifaucium]
MDGNDYVVEDDHEITDAPDGLIPFIRKAERVAAENLPDPAKLSDEERDQMREWMLKSIQIISEAGDGERHGVMLREIPNAFRCAAWSGDDWEDVQAAIETAYDVSGGTDTKDRDNIVEQAKEWAESDPKRYTPRAERTKLETMDAKESPDDAGEILPWYDARIVEQKARRDGLLEPTQQGVALRLRERYGQWLKYVNGDGWRTYKGGYWQPQNVGDVRIAVDSLTAEIRDELFSLSSETRRIENDIKVQNPALDAKELQRRYENNSDWVSLRADVSRWADLLERVQSTQWRNGVVQHAEDYLAADVSDFDTHPEMLTVENGTLKFDPETGNVELLPHDPSHLIARKAPVKYDPDVSVEGSYWQSTLDRLQPDVEVQRFLAMVAGLTLLGDNRKEIMVICHGEPATGKSTIVTAITATLGDSLTAQVSHGTIRESKRSGGDASPDKARLLGKRMVYVGELSGNVDVEMIKAWTGGEKISARALYQSEIEFLPQFVPWATSNSLPDFQGDEAIWRRVFVVEFAEVIPVNERMDKTTMNRLMSEQAPVILAWAIAGLADYFKNGLIIPDSVRAATEEARNEQAWQQTFVERFLTETGNPSDKVTLSTLKGLYDNSAREPAGRMSSRRLRPALEPLLGEAVKGVNGQEFLGWRVNESWNF